MDRESNPAKKPPARHPPGRARETALPGLLLALAFIALLCTQLRNEFNNPDGIGYYAHLRSVALDRDLFYLNEFERLKMTPYFFDPSPTGYIRNQWPVGCAVLWSPFFLAARAAGLTRGDGFTAADSLVISFATAFYGFLALWLCMGMLRGEHPRWRSFAAVAALWAGTPFLYYQFYYPALAHACSAFTTTCFMHQWLRVRRGGGWEGWALLGAAAGLMTMTRTENAVFCLLPLVDVFPGKSWSGSRPSILRLAAFVSAGALFFTPQMIVWQALNGSPFSSYQGTVNMLWANPHAWEVLFSMYHGLFTWAPATLPAVAGLLLYLRRDARAGAGLLLVFAGLLYVYSCPIWWWGSGAFGPRMFVGLFPVFAVGLGAFIRAAPGGAGIVAAACGAAWTTLLYAQTLAGKIWLIRFYPFEDLAGNALDVLRHPAESAVVLVAPKFEGLPALNAALWTTAAFAVLFTAVKFLVPKVRERRALPALACALIALDALLLVSWKNSESVRLKHAPEVAAAAEYPLEELYETFPLDYANYYVRTGRLGAAVREFRRLERLAGDNPGVPVAQAGVLLMLGERERALEKALKASGMNIRHPLTRRTLDRIMLDLGKKPRP
ncbi:MAG: hypothetical protein AB1742_10995 [bacterium]